MSYGDSPLWVRDQWDIGKYREPYYPLPIPDTGTTNRIMVIEVELHLLREMFEQLMKKVEDLSDEIAIATVERTMP